MLTTPLKVVEARAPRAERIRCYPPFQFGQSWIVLRHAVLGKHIPRTLLPTVHFSESGVGIRSYHASDPLLVFAAVEKMAPSSREAIGPEVPDECPLPALSPHGLMVQKSPMRAYSQVFPGVGQHATNEAVQFFFLCDIRLAIQKLTPKVP